jgi:hypothetical protein
MLTQGAGLNYLLPQWSPSLNGGSTPLDDAVSHQVVGTAMEPAIRRREHVPFGEPLEEVHLAAMEPAAERREHPNRYLSSFAWNWPQ